MATVFHSDQGCEMGTLLIRGGRIVTGSDEFFGDILVCNGRIQALGQDLIPTLGEHVERVIDATGLLVIPGGVDPHVHLAYPQGTHHILSSDDWLTGSVAAASGGTTSVIDFVEATPGQTWMEAFALRRAQAEAESVIDFGFHMSFNRTDEASLAQVPEVIAAGMPTFKIYMAYDGIRLEDRGMLIALRHLAKKGGLAIVHAEDHEVIMAEVSRCASEGLTSPLHHPATRPAAGEADATFRALSFAELAGCPMHIVHVSASRGLAAIRAFRSRGLPVTCEVTTQHLLLTEERYGLPGGEGCIMAPPLRTSADTEAMWEGLVAGDIDFTITDHCPFTTAQRTGKRRTPEFRKLPSGRVQSSPEDPWSSDMPPFYRMPGGGPGIETRVPLMYHYGVVKGRMSLSRFVDVTSSAAAKVFGLYPRKGTLAPGADADIVLFDPAEERVLHASALHQNCDYTPYEGMTLKGWPRTVISRGRVLVENFEWTGGNGGGGAWLERKIATR